MTTNHSPAGTGHIHLATELPGPESQRFNERRKAVQAQGVAQLAPITVASARGATVTDVDGNTLLDFAGGIGCLAVGHCPEEVTAQIRRQADELVHMCAIVANYPTFIEIAERLIDITPGDYDKRVTLGSSGAEAVEIAVKLARAHTGRDGVIVFEGAYHGRTNLTMAMTSKYGLFKKGFGPFASEVYRLPFPDLLRTPRGLTHEQVEQAAIAQLERALVSHIDPSDLAAIVIEPVLGEGGFVPTPTSFMQAIRRICDEHGVVMVADEIQSGFGRTGTMFAIEHTGVVPDLITMAKSMAAGMPLSAVVGRADILDAAHPGGLGGTFGGNPLACAAALATIDMMQAPEFLPRAVEVGDRMRSALEAMAAKHPDRICDVRGLGPMLAIELVTDAESLIPDPDATMAVCREALHRGLIIIRAGLFSNVVRLLPPLNIEESELSEALAVLDESVDAASAAGWV